MPDRDPAMCSTVTVFALSVSTQVGAPPIRRSVVSRQATRVPRVQSQTGITTRNRDQDSHAQNSQVRRPPIFGPSPQSNCRQRPGSGIHGR
ncbi:hypothetical protein ACFVRD_42270 [Streptomyces sp. NPDC057908]|uniref:hypothetical protein n=1 Tax=Streptomyces sp. NPDC057908 TaxID=3346276 RepID=UPI0036E892CD